MTDQQANRIITLLERIERHLAAQSGLVFVEEIETGARPIDGVVAPILRSRRRPPDE